MRWALLERNKQVRAAECIWSLHLESGSGYLRVYFIVYLTSYPKSQSPHHLQNGCGLNKKMILNEGSSLKCSKIQTLSLIIGFYRMDKLFQSMQRKRERRQWVWRWRMEVGREKAWEEENWERVHFAIWFGKDTEGLRKFSWSRDIWALFERYIGLGKWWGVKSRWKWL